MGFSSGLYGSNRMTLTLCFLAYINTSLVRCHRALSITTHSFLWLLCKRFRKGRNFFPLIFGLSFVITPFLPSAPNTCILCILFSTYTCVGRDPFLCQLRMKYGFRLNVLSSRKKTAYPSALHRRSLFRIFF